MDKKKGGFTLIELIVVIAILGILAALISGNFISSLKKGRDARRKADLQQIQKALESYYEDNLTYPNTLPASGTSLTHPDSEVNKTYMLKIPSDPMENSGYKYEYATEDGKNYKLYSCIENNLDQATGVNQEGYSGTSCGCNGCKFGISSPNTTL